MATGKIQVTQIRSEIGRNDRQRQTLRALGLGRIGRSVVHNATPSTIGMVKKVAHLVKTQPVAE